MSADGIVEGYARNYQFPLVLVIGGAASNEDNRLTKTGIGTYDFDASKSSFWDATYAIYGEANDLSAAEVKSICKKHNCSPIVFTDVCPYGVPNGTNKLDIYKEVSADEYVAHINNIFSLDSIIKRLELGLVILGSGHEELLDAANEYIKKKCEEKKILWVETPFVLSHYKKKENIEALRAKDCMPVLRKIHAKFLEETGKASS